jgi:hypothetical protein
MNKTCTSGHPCKYRFQDTGAIGWGCSYESYCDYQLPKDSRIYKFNSNKEFEKDK